MTTDDKATTFVDKLVSDTIATFELMGTYLGLRLGLYAALDEGPATVRDLASRAGIDQRYAQEWLEQQAVAGTIDVDDVALPADERTYLLPAAHRTVLLDETSPSFAGPLAYVAGTGGVLPQLLDAFRTGAGIPFHAYGKDIRDHIEQLNRPMFEADLASAWIPAVPGLRERLDSDPPARVLDLACGAGWSSITLARAYPSVRIDGLDLDEDYVTKARANAAAAGVDGRVSFEARDVADPALSSSYDLVLIFEALHDMAQPVAALAAARRALVPGGSVLVGDEKVGERFTAPGDKLERLMYGFSIVHCLPASRTEDDSAATGTVMRPDTLRRYAHEAGFEHVEVLPVSNDMWRFYLLRES
jgi:2-polyprenyl-3-methyl-5-hydroxy-6-metoxy-1,4-benzoquinol methylase